MKLNPRWQWKLAKLENWLMDRKEEFAQLWKGVKVQHKMCPECRGLVDKKASACPLCGTKLTGVPVGGVGRFVGGFFPKSGFYTATILAINILLYLATSIISARQYPENPFSLLTGAHPMVMINFGADLGLLIQHGEFWRWVTAIFLHAGLLHLGFNSLALYSIGPQMEEIYGQSKFIFIYLLTGVGGYVLNFVVAPDHGPTLGASGSIFGLIGVMAIYGHRRGGELGHAIRRAMIQWAVYGLVLGFFMGANNWAHAGGLITGCLLSFIINESSYKGALGGLWGVLEGLSVLTILVAFTLNFVNYGTWAKWLR